MTDSAIARRSLLFLALVIALLLSACSLIDPAARDDGRMRAILQADFPGFRVVKLTYDDSGFAYSDSGRLVDYQFQLESEAVPGFVLYGTRNLLDAGGSRNWGPIGTMFSSKQLTTGELVELENLWVCAYPGSEIWVGDDMTTGPYDPVILNGEFQVSPRYAHVLLSQVYTLDGSQDSAKGWNPDDYFFRLDPKSQHWTQLRGFLHAQWE